MEDEPINQNYLIGCDTIENSPSYNLKESEKRQLERIEEELLKTGKGCPITQLYLQVGQTPARFEIIKTRLLYLKYILNQNQDSMLSKFFKIQMKSPSKGDWVSMCLDNLKDLQIESSFEDIEKMSCTQFKNLLKEKVKSAAFIYLIEKQLSKGGEIEYTELKMSDYLLPNNELSIEEKIQVFSIRNKMDKNIPANFCSSQKISSVSAERGRVYMYEKIYSENVKDIKAINERFQENMNSR